MQTTDASKTKIFQEIFLIGTRQGSVCEHDQRKEPVSMGIGDDLVGGRGR